MLLHGHFMLVLYCHDVHDLRYSCIVCKWFVPHFDVFFRDLFLRDSPCIVQGLTPFFSCWLARQGLGRPQMHINLTSILWPIVTHIALWLYPTIFRYLFHRRSHLLTKYAQHATSVRSYLGCSYLISPLLKTLLYSRRIESHIFSQLSQTSFSDLLPPYCQINLSECMWSLKTCLSQNSPPICLVRRLSFGNLCDLALMLGCLCTAQRESVGVSALSLPSSWHSTGGPQTMRWSILKVKG